MESVRSIGLSDGKDFAYEGGQDGPGTHLRRGEASSNAREEALGIGAARATAARAMTVMTRMLGMLRG